MQFTFYEGAPDGGTRVSSRATGWAIRDGGPNEDQFGFFVEDDQGVYDVDFSIPELRQMLAEAEELASKNESPCNCDCQTYAPLATEQELADEAQKVPADDNTPSPRDEIERLLRKAETQADSTVDFCIVAQARKDLLG